MDIRSEKAGGQALVKIGYKPHEKQMAFHASGAKFRAFIGGIGSGKTFAGCQEALRITIEFPGTIGIIAAPTYRMLEDVTKKTFLDFCPRKLVESSNKAENTVTLINGSKILFRSADDPEKLRGPNIDFFYVDEASLIAHMAWKILIGRIRRGRVDKGWVTTTPKGFNWIWEEFVEKAKKDHEHFTCETSQNPFLPPGFIESVYGQYVGVFRKQELFGEFVLHEGIVYEDFSRKVHVIGDIPGTFKKVIAGVDWGFTNPSVILVVGEDSDGRMYVIDEFYKTKTLPNDLIQVAKDLKAKHRIEEFRCDPSEPAQIEEFNGNGLKAIAAENEVMGGIAKISERLTIQEDGRPRLFVSRKCANTIMEFENYCYPETKEGKPVRENPVKVLDHAMDALRYAVAGSKEFKFAFDFVDMSS